MLLFRFHWCMKLYLNTRTVWNVRLNFVRRLSNPLECDFAYGIQTWRAPLVLITQFSDILTDILGWCSRGWTRPGPWYVVQSAWLNRSHCQREREEMIVFDDQRVEGQGMFGHQGSRLTAHKYYTPAGSSLSSARRARPRMNMNQAAINTNCCWHFLLHCNWSTWKFGACAFSKWVNSSSK